MLNLYYISDKQDSFREGLKLMKKAGKGKICYVTLNKSCSALKEALKKKKMSSKKVFFIDAISSVISAPPKVDECVFVKAPYDLAGIKRKINWAIKNDYTFIIFDSISNLLAYGQRVPAGNHTLVKFIKSFSNSLKKKNGEAFFIAKSSDKENLLIEETLATFDKVIGGKK